jgi:hypothetical protein
LAAALRQPRKSPLTKKVAEVYVAFSSATERQKPKINEELKMSDQDAVQVAKEGYAVFTRRDIPRLFSEDVERQSPDPGSSGFLAFFLTLYPEPRCYNPRQ